MIRRRVLLLASYCGTDDESCNASTPCNDCLVMCNVADIDCTIVENYGGLDFVREMGLPPHPSQVHPDPSRARDEVTERSPSPTSHAEMKAGTAKS